MGLLYVNLSDKEKYKGLWEDIPEYFDSDYFKEEYSKLLYDTFEKVYEQKRFFTKTTLINLMISESDKQTVKWKDSEYDVEFVNDYLEFINNNSGIKSRLEYYCKVLETQKKERDLTKALDKAQGQVGLQDLESLVGEIQDDIENVSSDVETKEAVNIGELGEERFEKFLKNKGEAKGFEVKGWARFNAITLGIEKSKLIIIAARPSMGKTAFAVHMANSLSSQGIGVAFFSLEQPALEIQNRALAQRTNIRSNDLKDYNFVVDNKLEDKIRKELKIMKNKQFLIEDTGGIKVEDLDWKIKKLVSKGVEVIFVDYLTLLATKEKRLGEVGTVSHISKRLKIIAKKYNVAIVSMAQLSRGVEKREDRRPIMSDIRESGQIEQDADRIIFLYRDGYYKEDPNKIQDLEVIVAKNRDGDLGKIFFKYQMDLNLFVEFNPEQFKEKIGALSKENKETVMLKEYKLLSEVVGEKHIGLDWEIRGEVKDFVSRFIKSKTSKWEGYITSFQIRTSNGWLSAKSFSDVEVFLEEETQYSFFGKLKVNSKNLVEQEFIIDSWEVLNKEEITKVAVELFGDKLINKETGEVIKSENN